MTDLDPWLLEHLLCPVDHSPLKPDADALVSAAGRRYPVVDGVPVMLVEGEQTIWVLDNSMRKAGEQSADPYRIDSVGVSDDMAAQIRTLIAAGTSPVDPVISYIVGSTNGIAYLHLIGKLQEYPIPELRLPPGNGRTLLDVGCNWGRWCAAAARLGYTPVGLDPSLGAVLAAKRMFKDLGLNGRFVVGDARRLPFREGTFDQTFSYSVLQHFSRSDAAAAVRELGRALKPGGESLVQMATTLGIRCVYHQLRRRFREPSGFEVRYYSVPALRSLFTAGIGPTSTSVDCYFGIGLQRSDIPHMTPVMKGVVWGSEVLRGVSRVFPPLKYVADSVYLHSRKPG